MKISERKKKFKFNLKSQKKKEEKKHHRTHPFIDYSSI